MTTVSAGTSSYVCLEESRPYMIQFYAILNIINILIYLKQLFIDLKV